MRRGNVKLAVTIGNKIASTTDPWVKTGLLRLEFCSIDSQAAADGPLTV